MPEQEVHLTDETFDDEVANGVILVDMWAPWCRPCLIQGPILEKVAELVGDRAQIAKLNLEEEQRVAARLGVQAIPTLILLKDGQEVRRFVGVQREDVLVAAIEHALES